MRERRWSTLAVLILILASLPLFAVVPPAPQPVAEAPPETVPPVLSLPPITAPAEVPQAAVADRLSPMIQEIPIPACNEAGLHCLPFYTGDPADLCAELNFYRMQNPVTAAEPRFSDQPRSGPKKMMGIGWRESGCDN